MKLSSPLLLSSLATLATLLPFAAAGDKAKVFNFDVLDEKEFQAPVVAESKNPLEGVNLDQLVNVVYITLDPSTVFVTVTETFQTVYLSTATTTITALPKSSLSSNATTTVVSSSSSARVATTPTSGLLIIGTKSPVSDTSSSTPAPLTTSEPVSSSSATEIPATEPTPALGGSEYDELVQFVSSVFSSSASTSTTTTPSSVPLASSSSLSSSVVSSSSKPKSSVVVSTKLGSNILNNGTHKGGNFSHGQFDDDSGNVFDPYENLPVSDFEVNFSNGSNKVNIQSVLIGMFATVFVFGVFAL